MALSSPRGAALACAASSPRRAARRPPTAAAAVSPARAAPALAAAAAAAAATAALARLARQPHHPRSGRVLLACRAASSSSSSSSSFSSDGGASGNDEQRESGGNNGGGGGRPTSTSPWPSTASPSPPGAPPPASASASGPQRQQQPPLGADDAAPPDHSGAYASAEAAERLWRRLTAARRELARAVEGEDFAAAAALRDEVASLTGSLPPVRQYVLHQLERLRTGEAPAPLGSDGSGDLGFGGVGAADGSNGSSGGGGSGCGGGGGAVVAGGSILDSPPPPTGGSTKKKTGATTRGIRAENNGSNDDNNDNGGEDAAAERRLRASRERLAAVAALAEAGDAAVLPDLARALRDPELQAAAQEAMWAVFGRSPDPHVAEAMEEGGKLLGAGAGGPGGTNPSLEAALAAFDRVLERAPDFAEAHNKRATVLYLLGRHAQAVEACARCLAHNPWHFGAASGAGLCHVALQQPAEALAAFERALGIHPGLTQISRYASALRATVAEQRQQQQEQGQGEQQQEGEGGGDGGGVSVSW